MDPPTPAPTILERQIQALQLEEARVFELLHELAEAISRESSSSRLSQIIVLGAARALEASSGAFYSVDKSGTQLVPGYLGAECPPLIPVPEEIKSSGSSLLSFLQLRAVPVSQGILGRCFTEQIAIALVRTESVTDWDADLAQQGGARLIFAPLSYGARKLGVLILYREGALPPFPPHSFSIFRALAEQCGFALGTALMQGDALEARRMEGELRAASEVQQVLLPKHAPNLSDYIIAADNVAARIVSGDYYDFLTVDETHTGVMVADVSGKGIPASLVMASCRGLLRGSARGVRSPAQALATVNRLIFNDIKEDMFISAAYVMLERTTNEIFMARAGHDAPFLFRKATGEASRLEPPGVAMGVDDGDVFERVTKDFAFTMESGDCLLLFTDGVNEAENAEGELFGLERLEAAFCQSAPRGAAAVLAHIQAQIAEFAGPVAQSDDITLVVIEKR